MDETPVSFRSGMMVRVANPRSQHVGATGYLLGRDERRKPYWLVLLTTSATPVRVLEQEIDIVQ